MFNRYYSNNHSTEYVPYAKTVTVNEHKAATDESIRIYGEMVDKARQNLLDKFTLSSPTLGEIHLATYRDHLSYGNFIIYYKFLLQGEQIDGKIELDNFEDAFKSRKQIVDKVIKSVSTKIATKLAKQIVVGALTEDEIFRYEFHRRDI
jgi:hypothetical protein